MPPFALTRARARYTALTLAAATYAARLGVAAAEPNAPVAPASLELDADPSCVTRAGLISRVRARSPRVRFLDEGGLAIRVQIAMTPTGTVTAEVTLASLGSDASIRHVPAGSCTEAADAVALIIAVTLDPTSADARRNSTAPDDAAAAADVNGAADGTAGNAGAPTTSAPKPALPAPSSRSAAETATDALRSSRSRPGFGLQLAGEAFFGVAPGIMPGVALYGIVGIERPSLWSPSVVLGVRHAWRSEIPELGGKASFALDAATLDTCPLRFRWRAIEARPCASVLFGRVTARGSETLNPAAESARPFWVIGGAAIASVDLPARLLLSTRLALGGNLVRDSFEFRPALFHEVPLVSATVGVAMGMRWEEGGR